MMITDMALRSTLQQKKKEAGSPNVFTVMDSHTHPEVLDT